MNEEKQEKGSGLMIPFLLGALTGAGLFFLFGTEKGRKIKKELKKKGGLSFDNLEDLFKNFEEKGGELKERAIETVKKLEEKATGADEEARGMKTKDEGKEMGHIEELQEKGRKIAGRFFKRNGRSLK